MFSAASARLSVCLFVCQRDNFRTTKRLNLAVTCILQKISPEFECQGKRSKVKVTGDKKTKKCGILFGSGPRGAVLYAGGKISACCVIS